MSFDRPRGDDRSTPPTSTRTTPSASTNNTVSIDERKLSDLREEFGGHRIWRSPRRDGGLGCWVASLHDPNAGIDPTLVCDTAEALRAALLDERERAAARGDHS
ncbi:hypothetical protein [Actinomadura gamaensis]|uniref:Uncharacterized protein n=1 Tax=Actinomadura gamaensis TaxID=1763541 RepID=A0ABV9TW82_9ACTN